MKHLRITSICLAIFFAFSMAFCVDVEARASKKSTSRVTQGVDRKKPSKSISRDKKDSSKSASASKKSKKTCDLVIRNPKKPDRRNAKNRDVDCTAQSAERDVWLKRARESEILLSGKASWYGKDFHNKATASGMNYDMHTFTAAHRTLPLGTVVKVTDQHNGKSVMVCVTDRGPYVHGRIIDLSYAAAKQLDLSRRGVGKVKLEVISDEKGMPLKSDHAYFIKYGSRNQQGKVGPFHAFSDAAAMHEALSKAHPDAQVILDKSQEKSQRSPKQQ